MLTVNIHEHILFWMPGGSGASGAPSLAFLTYPASAHLPISCCHLGIHSKEDTLSAWPWGWVCERGAPFGAPWLLPFLWCALTGTQALTPTPSPLAVSSPCVWVLWNTGLYQPVGVVAISALTSSHPRSPFSHCTLTSHSIYSLTCHAFSLPPLWHCPSTLTYLSPFLPMPLLPLPRTLLATGLTRVFFTTRPLPPIFFFSSLNQYRHLSPELLLLSVPITLSFLSTGFTVTSPLSLLILFICAFFLLFDQDCKRFAIFLLTFQRVCFGFDNHHFFLFS